MLGGRGERGRGEGGRERVGREGGRERGRERGVANKKETNRNQTAARRLCSQTVTEPQPK